MERNGIGDERATRLQLDLVKIYYYLDQLTRILIYQKLSILSVVNITCVASQYKYFKAIDVG